MAATWTAYGSAIAWATAAKTMFQLYNGAASGQVLRVYRMWLINAQTAGVTGVISPIYIIRITTVFAAGTNITPIAHDSTSSALTTVTCTTGSTVGTITNLPVFRRWQYSSEEPATGTTKIENLYALPPFCLLWDGGYVDSNVEPIVLKANEGIVLYQPALTGAVGTVDIACEFTSAAS